MKDIEEKNVNAEEVAAAVAMALDCYMRDTAHDEESYVITIRRRQSAWTGRFND